MIDQTWFELIDCIADAGIGTEERKRIAQLLGEEEEVFPFLLLTRHSFAAWPHTTDAMKRALRSVIRPTANDEESGNVLPDATFRHDLRIALLDAISQNAAKDGDDAKAWLADKKIFSPRSDADQSRIGPQSFIPLD